MNRNYNRNKNKNYQNNKKYYIDYNKELFKISKLNVRDGDILMVQVNDNSIKLSELKRFIDLIPSRINKDINIIVTPKDVELKTINEKELDNIIERLIDIKDSIKKGDVSEAKNN